MAYDLLGAGGLANSMKQFYSRRLLDRTMPLLVHIQFGQKDGIPTRGGKSIEWRRWERPSAVTTALTEGTPGANTNITISNVTATVSQYGAYAIYSDVVDTQNFDPYLMGASDVFGEQAGISLDTIVRNVIVAGTTVQYASIATTRGGASGVASGMYFTYPELREAVRTLRRNDAPAFEGGKYTVIYTPETEEDFFSDSDVVTTFQNAGARGGSNPMFTGEVGDFYGSRFIRTSQAKIWYTAGRSSADVHATLVFGRGWFGVVDYEAMGLQMIVHPVSEPSKEDPLNQKGTVGWKASITAAILDQNRGVRIEHVVSSANMR